MLLQTTFYIDSISPAFQPRMFPGRNSPPEIANSPPPEIFCRPQFIERVIPYVAVRIQEETQWGGDIPSAGAKLVTVGGVCRRRL